MDTPPEATSYAYLCRFVACELMRALKDTELRLFILVAYKTLGWNKKNDWLNHTQLETLTGKKHAAISSAIKSLTVKGYIEPSDENGSVLMTPDERKRYGYTRHHMHYRISPALIQKVDMYYAEKRTLTNLKSRHYKSTSYKTISSQTKVSEEKTSLEEQNQLSMEITNWMTRPIYSIKLSSEEVILQVFHTVKKYGVVAIQKIYDSVANCAQPGHPREFWNAVKALKKESKPEVPLKVVRQPDSWEKGVEGMGQIMHRYNIPVMRNMKD